VARTVAIRHRDTTSGAGIRKKVALTGYNEPGSLHEHKKSPLCPLPKQRRCTFMAAIPC